MLEWMERPHRRLNLLTGDWILVSPNRAARPWQGQVERADFPDALFYDPSCYLCPGNERAGGVRNPKYLSTFVFDNDFPALLPQEGKGSLNERGLLKAATEAGVCRVMCFSPRHDLAIPSMELDDLVKVVDTWRHQLAELHALPFVNNVQIFENRGIMMGASNPHPHCQIWASENIPNEIRKEDYSQRQYLDQHASCLLCDYLNVEAVGERSVCENDSFAVVVPFWAVWPFETMLISKRHFGRLDQTIETEDELLAAILRQITRRYDRLFGTAFPYSFGFHQPPKRTESNIDAWHLHGHFYPPLLRSATIRKFMVGYELLAESQRDITPEMAAARLREGS